MLLNVDQLLSEVTFSFSRSGGKGGQHVNKTESKAELYFSIPNSLILDDVTKQQLLEVLASKLDSEGVLRLTSSAERSQASNRDKVIKKFIALITQALKPKKTRKKTKISKAAQEARLEKKHKRGLIKEARKKVAF